MILDFRFGSKLAEASTLPIQIGIRLLIFLADMHFMVMNYRYVVLCSFSSIKTSRSDYSN